MVVTTPSLIGDIGGTNVRLALVEPDSRQPRELAVLSREDHEDLCAAIHAYLDSTRPGTEPLQSVCLAIASPLAGSDDDTVFQMTNSPWRFSRRQLKDEFGWRRLKLLNDFTAMALGASRLSAEDLVPLGGGRGDPQMPRLVIGPGTGLGISALVPLDGGWLPLETEGGHVDFAPADEIEDAVLRLLRQRYGRVSVERLLCGQGLVDLYQALAEIQGKAQTDADVAPAPPAITAAAVNRSDPLAELAVEKFSEMLGRAAGNAVLNLGAFGGVFLYGGLLSHFQELFLRSNFRSAFEDKGRMRELMQNTPVWLITEPYTGLLGAAEALANPRV